MVSVEDIWGEDISVDPLFHDDGLASSPSRAANQATASTKANATDTTFNDDFDFDFTAQRVDQLAILKEANAKNSRQVHAATLSQEPTRRSGTQPDAEGRAETGKKARVFPKLDDDRLLGQDGFPALFRETRNFKLSEMGHEMQDLPRLLYLYQLWGHKMFPKMQFREMIERVEKLCHRQNVMRAYQAYQKAEEEIKNGSREEDEGVQVNIFPDSRENSPAPDEQGETSEAIDATSDMETNVDADLAAMLEDMAPSQVNKQAKSNENHDPEMDVDALLDEELDLERSFTSSGLFTQEREGDDEEMWNLVHEIEAQGAENVDKAPAEAVQVQEDSDDDLYVND